jgi:hypothetical protein
VNVNDVDGQGTRIDFGYLLFRDFDGPAMMICGRARVISYGAGYLGFFHVEFLLTHDVFSGGKRRCDVDGI